ncbi:MAG: hypothetical protein ACK5RL_18720 [Acidimicrobiales bacterium]
MEAPQADRHGTGPGAGGGGANGSTPSGAVSAEPPVVVPGRRAAPPPPERRDRGNGHEAPPPRFTAPPEWAPPVVPGGSGGNGSPARREPGHPAPVPDGDQGFDEDQDFDEGPFPDGARAFDEERPFFDEGPHRDGARSFDGEPSSDEAWSDEAWSDEAWSDEAWSDEGPGSSAAWPIAVGAGPRPQRLVQFARSLAGPDQPLVLGVVGFTVAVVCALFVFVQMRPDLLFTATTPAGGDMGAHVWGPLYLRDELLPNLRLNGWTPDWYAGFPAYQFYMVIPSLAIVALNAGFSPFIGVPLAALVGVGAWRLARGRGHRHLVAAVVVSVVAAVLLISLPYGVAFKLVSVSGLVTMPISAWLMGRFSRAPEPVPAFLAVATTIFLFDTNFTIYGGNIASTLAGEFAFSISLSLALLAIGLTMRGLDSGRGRVVAAVVIALVALTHIIPLFFTIAALGLVVLLPRGANAVAPISAGAAMVLIAHAVDGSAVWVLALSVVALVGVFAASAVADPAVTRRVQWLFTTAVVSVLLSSFWLLPFVFRHKYFNDMGWEVRQDVAVALGTAPMRVALPIALLGILLSFGFKERIGMLFGVIGVVAAVAVDQLGQGPLWNARILPFYYLATYLTAAVGIGLSVRAVVQWRVVLREAGDGAGVGPRPSWPRMPGPTVPIVVSASVVAVVVALVGISIPLRAELPGRSYGEDGTYRWMGIVSNETSIIPSWTAWNYTGYERKETYREYHDVVDAMIGVGETNGCGRAMWEYDRKLDRYGTPMALMLLPMWSDGCIGSMEGLYFESSATTPFHFLNQSKLSLAPSRAQRDLPYQDFSVEGGVTQLQVMGVRYYMATTDDAIEAARNEPRLVEVAEAQPFVVFEVADSELVEPLDTLPVVVTGPTEEQMGPLATRFDVGWLSQAVTYYNNPAYWSALPAEDGPDGWPRAEILADAPTEAVTAPSVSNITTGTDTIRFEVDQPGTPVLVKASYFPNWKASGAEGPWRVGPNLMVVVPTDTTVELSYGRTWLDWLGLFLTAAGVVGLVGLAKLDTAGRGRPEGGGSPVPPSGP